MLKNAVPDTTGNQAVASTPQSFDPTYPLAPKITLTGELRFGKGTTAGRIVHLTVEEVEGPTAERLLYERGRFTTTFHIPSDDELAEQHRRMVRYMRRRNSRATIPVRILDSLCWIFGWPPP